MADARRRRDACATTRARGRRERRGGRSDGREWVGTASGRRRATREDDAETRTRTRGWVIRDARACATAVTSSTSMGTAGGAGAGAGGRRWRFLAAAATRAAATKAATGRGATRKANGGGAKPRRREKKLSRKEEAGRRLASGTLATVCVRTVLAPLERVKIEYLLNRSTLKLEAMVGGILRTEGALGFWKGNMLNIARTAPFKAINFCAFDTYREIVNRTFPEGSDARKIGLVCAGAGAGMTAVVTCFPMDVLRTRLLTTGGKEKYGSFFACVKMMYRQEGMSTFYRGITPALVSMVPNAAVYYSVYDGLKNRRLAQLNAELAATRKKSGSKQAEENSVKNIEQKNMMLYGAVAGVASEASTYPFEVIRRRMQMQSGRSSTAMVFGRKALLSMATTLRSVARESGLKSLYAGLGPSCVQVLPSAALGYYTYEMFKLLLEVD